MIENNDRAVPTVLAGSPCDRPWEGCVNSVVYRVPRGVAVTIPAFLAEHIKTTEAERAAAERRAERFSAAARRLN